MKNVIPSISASKILIRTFDFKKIFDIFKTLKIKKILEFVNNILYYFRYDSYSQFTNFRKLPCVTLEKKFSLFLRS